MKLQEIATQVSRDHTAALLVRTLISTSEQLKQFEGEDSKPSGSGLNFMRSGKCKVIRGWSSSGSHYSQAQHWDICLQVGNNMKTPTPPSELTKTLFKQLSKIITRTAPRSEGSEKAIHGYYPEGVISMIVDSPTNYSFVAINFSK